ncbi:MULTISPECIES: rhodanese-like domain-containing protein [Pseudomonas]|uniref:Rhodanese-like domain-containing protein n=2 Tax=Pseudomonas TaxID=286 RepID=A0A3M8T7M1_PSEPU|nr:MULTISPECIES: rhodanese-like domain-containing protein [Pseudomonas]MCO6690160.1 rhodanese-like domain-containing protein [Pseudomonas shirazica]MCE0850024.1 rhodanese-like domain-containing protein [Pseudomonas asiatica]MDZ5737138.1 rhodanese-like domain-containing protein [Pseudomonas asiatica]MDZ5742184.1 rhodanese-like domain-containing protein [Pseudomonas asiatica]MDZ5747368.1 rhodanese-like domain-containing protein [Pseudomonas asiatica]
MPSLVSEYPAASPSDALLHFSRHLAFETDCSDVERSQRSGDVDYVLVDVRSSEAFAQGHVPGAINIPGRTISAERMADYARQTLFVVYCAGPHCNGVHRAAVRLAELGFPVKEMIGGVTGWLDEGFSLVGADVAAQGNGVSCAC